MERKVSLILPVYNVEKYLPQCLDSIQKQSYKNMEIIIVNDGSTDGSGQICETFSKRDTRVKYIQKKNGGLSSARNVGLKYAVGDYIVFVDSDDFIRSGMISSLVEVMECSHADIACCNYEVCNEQSGVIYSHKINIKSMQVFTRQQAIDVLFYETFFQCYAWNKMYKKELFTDIKYPEGRLYEDIVTTYRLFRSSEMIAFIPDSLYCYRRREGSITQKQFKPKSYDLIDSINEVIEQNQDNRAVLAGCAIYYLYFIDEMIKHNVWDKDVYHKYQAIVKKTKNDIYRCTNIACSRKIQLILCYLNPGLYKQMYKGMIRLLKK